MIDWRRFEFPSPTSCVTLLLLIASCGRQEGHGEYSGTIEFQDVAVGSLIGGRVLEVRKQEGEAAHEGEALIVLDPEEWQYALKEAEALVERSARELALLEAGPRPEDIERAEAEAKRLELVWRVRRLGARDEEIAQAREDVAGADALWKEATARLEREEKLVRRGSTTAEALDHARANKEAARARRAAAKQRLHLLQRGARPEEIEAAHQAYLAQLASVRRLKAGYRKEDIDAKRASLSAAKARADVTRYKLSELTIKAPADCLVQTLDLRAGDLLQAGEPVAVLILREAPWITIYVPENKLAQVELGGEATVFPDGHPPLGARVAWISREAEYTPRNVQTKDVRTTQVFAVKLTLRGDASRLKDGMWADVRIR